MHKKLALSLTFLTLIFLSSFATAAEIVNLNKASAAAIQQNLVGIGPIKADAIISYRKKNGKFKSLDDLQNVTGIGPALIKKNKRYLSLTKGVVAGDDKAYAAAKKKSKSTTSSKKTTSKSTKKTTSKSTKDKDSNKAKTTQSKSTPSKSKKKNTSKTKTDKKKSDKKKTTKKKKTSKSTT